MPPARSKHFLYYAPAGERRERLRAELSAVPETEVEEVRGQLRVLYGTTETRWSVAADAEHVMEQLRSTYVHLLIIDMRCVSEDMFSECRRQGLELIDQLDDTDDVEARYGFHRIITLVSGPQPAAVDQLMVDLGARGVRTVLRQVHEEVESAAFFTQRMVDTGISLVMHRHRGKRALCAAGGGVTGIYFELGALKCLDDCLSDGAVNTFDMYFGISAGAVVTSLLVVGYSIDEIMGAVAGSTDGRLPSLDFRLLRLRHMNYADFGRRFGIGFGSMMRYFGEVAKGREALSFNDIVIELADSAGPPFHSSGFEKMLRGVLEHPEACNEFRGLPRELYIGATDQDARQHVLFGAEPYADYPISQAVQASLSLNPAFSAAAIDGRYYEDGAVTRTSNYVAAIERDATLVFVIDPFLPYVSKEPGVSHSRGMLYNADQNIRTISYTRYENLRSWVLRKHPNVSSYTFLPSNRLRRVLSMSPMDHRPYMEIWRGAYLSTLQRIHLLCHRMRGDLGAHGIQIDTRRADIVASQLRETPRPAFRDFFPGREVHMRKPPLVHSAAHRRAMEQLETIAAE